VCELNKAAGDSADRSERVVAIYDPATVAIEVRVPEDDLDRVTPGLKAHVAIRGTKMSFDAEVTIVNATPARLPGEMKTAPATPESAYDRYVACRVSVPEELKKQIRPGMSANVTIYTW
jgi:multidrug resistance efflux pump